MCNRGGGRFAKKLLLTAYSLKIGVVRERCFDNRELGNAMKINLQVICFLMIAFLMTCSSVAIAQKPDPVKVSGKINWLYDYEQAKIESLKMNKPMFVVIRCER